MTVCDMAGDSCRIASLSPERSQVESAACYLDLLYASVRSYSYRLCTSLSAVVRLMCETVEENVPLTVYLDDTAVSSTGHIHSCIVSNAVYADIAV